MIKWIFFDVGSTLVDETKCTEYRMEALLRQKNAPGREVLLAKMDEFAAPGKNAYRETAAFFGLQTAPWPCHLEQLYEDTLPALQNLRQRFRLGVIANQVPGLEKRLEKFGILDYFEMIAGSGDIGLAKPSPEIFQYALDTADCRPEEAVMVGDRLDNDIMPAARLGMKTVWLRRGNFCGSSDEAQTADFVIHDLSALTGICLSTVFTPVKGRTKCPDPTNATK